MKWLVDAQLPPALARMLAASGLDAVHVDDIGLRHADDNPIWKWAVENQAIIITKDEDFPRHALTAKIAPVVVWLRVGNTSRRALLVWLARLLPKIEAEIDNGERIIEVR